MYCEVRFVRSGGGEGVRKVLGVGHHVLQSTPLKPGVRGTTTDNTTEHWAALNIFDATLMWAATNHH